VSGTLTLASLRNLTSADRGRIEEISRGPTPCTLGTYDLYWMAVDPTLHGAGIGSAMVRAMERRLAGAARLIVVETAGRPEYAPTRAFYQARGYRFASRIPDFYAPGDDQVVFVKVVSRES
jgi:D-alanine-D-alanine ligase